MSRRRMMGAPGEQEPFEGFLVRGKFTDDSGPEDWWCKIGNVVVDLTPFVDPITKEFEYRQKDKPLSLVSMWEDNSRLERIETIGGADDLRSVFKMFSYCAPAFKYADISNIPAPLSQRFAYEYLFFNTTIEHAIVNIDMSLAPTTEGMFSLARSLQTVEGYINNISQSIYLGACPLTNDSAQVFINGLAEVETPQTITFSAATYATLTPEQIALAESKNWIVAHA